MDYVDAYTAHETTVLRLLNNSKTGSALVYWKKSMTSWRAYLQHLVTVLEQRKVEQYRIELRTFEKSNVFSATWLFLLRPLILIILVGPRGSIVYKFVVSRFVKRRQKTKKQKQQKQTQKQKQPNGKSKNKTKNKTKKNNNRYNYIQLWWLKMLQLAPWVIRALSMSALTKTTPLNCNLLGLLIFGNCCCQKHSMLLIALLVKTELLQCRGFDYRSHVDRHIYISAPRAAKLSMLRSAGRLVSPLACCTPYRTHAAG